ncbi:hypothetical protein DYB32_008982 [Aphanomyces invadans]|uniref:Secreted protein n=1 Tax=Aphanomyces invadans TaxID=157072 RepID=A0A3R7A3K6_9STRA|nr:hypothetical protein DYB32_008982 [Aphanomyces invadans]
MQFTHLFAVLSLAAVARADCDSDVTTANAVLFTQACMNDLQGGDRLSYATVFEDYRSNANTIYKYGLCGSTTCKDEVAASNYPTCAVTSATSYTAEVAGLATACGTLDTAVAANGGTCTEAQIADNIWAKHVVVLDSACATGISATAGSSWYTVFQTLDTATPSTLTDYCATSACVDLATTTKAKLASCTDGTDSNKDLYAARGDAVAMKLRQVPGFGRSGLGGKKASSRFYQLIRVHKKFQESSKYLSGVEQDEVSSCSTGRIMLLDELVQLFDEARDQRQAERTSSAAKVAEKEAAAGFVRDQQCCVDVTQAREIALEQERVEYKKYEF